RLLKALGQTAIMVCHHVPDAQKLIRNFQSSSAQWIVSVGMVSEGTDIPRLQVCCHLSRIKTELYFRQVLGRVLRKRHQGDKEAWLFVLAEPELSEFARRISEDLPGDQVLMAANIAHETAYVESKG